MTQLANPDATASFLAYRVAERADEPPKSGRLWLLPGLWAATVLVLAAPLARAVDLTRQIDFKIPPQSLSAALIQFSHQARIQIIIREDIRSRKTPGITGLHAIADALRGLLRGSGLQYRVVSDTSIVIGRNLTELQSTTSSTRNPSPPETPAVARNSIGSVGPDTSGTQGVEGEQAPQSASNVALQEVVVLGSLLPQPKLETSSPVITITSQDMKKKGFTSVADALQNLSVSTGAVNNASISDGYDWSAKRISLFGLDSSYTKFLIDGRPMPAFSQIIEGSVVDELINNLSGIPIDLVDRIEILPGSSSSLYGSDAVAGVVNIILKKHAKLATVSATYGWYANGGGDQRKFSFMTNFGNDRWNVLLGAQVGDQQPMWDYQRGTTAQNFAGGVGPEIPYPVAGIQSLTTGAYDNLDPENCAKLSGLWAGTVQNVDGYCGSNFAFAHSTLINRDESDSLFTQISYTVNEKLKLYSDILDTYEEQSHAQPLSWSGQWYDASENDVLLGMRSFAPEEMGSNDLLNETDYENTLMATIGAKGDIASGWIYDASVTLSREGLNDQQVAPWGNSEPNSFGSYFLGPELGSLPGFGSAFPIYAANFSNFYTPLTPQQLAAFTDVGSIESSSRNDTANVQVSQPALFSLPGGNAGLALLAEAGHEGWSYLPDQALTSGALLNIAFNPSGGTRNRYAGAAELKMPVLKKITLDTSGRYDAYDAEGTKLHDITYSLGLEIRPVRSVLLRGKYGTGFKAPTLVDEFEGLSTTNSLAIDFLNCGRLGFSGANLGNCPGQYLVEPVIMKNIRNPALQPIKTQSWSYGIVWTSGERMTLHVDYQHLNIRDEILAENINYLLQNELYCDDGTFSASSPTCEAAAAQIIRAPATPGSPLAGNIEEVVLSKINLASENDNSVNLGGHYGFGAGVLGQFAVDLAYTDVLEHAQETFPGEPVKDLLSSPGYSTEFKTKVNASLSWNRGYWDATIAGTRFGKTPNYAAVSLDSYSAVGAGTLPPWYIWNASLGYTRKAFNVSIIINNAGNSMPPIDRTQVGSYNVPFEAANYNPYGREFAVDARYEFGGQPN